MTDLRRLTILGLMSRLLAHIDGGESIPPQLVQEAIADGTILDLLRERLGDFPEFAPIRPAESALLRQELRSVMQAIDGREKRKLGIQNNGIRPVNRVLAWCGSFEVSQLETSTWHSNYRIGNGSGGGIFRSSLVAA